MDTETEAPTAEELATKVKSRRNAALILFSKIKEKPSEELDKILARLGIRIK